MFTDVTQISAEQQVGAERTGIWGTSVRAEESGNWEGPEVGRSRPEIRVAGGQPARS